MRTTLVLNDALFAEAKMTAARTGRTLSQVIEDSLRRTLMPRPPRSADRSVVLPTSPGTPIVAGMLDDADVLRDVMDGLG